MIKPVKGFRLDENLVKSLKNKADQKGLNLNAMVSNILENYDSVYYHLEQNHFQWVSPTLMKQIMDMLTDSQLKKLAHILSSDWKNQIKYTFDILDLETIGRFLHRHFAMQNITIKSTEEDSIYKYTVFHNMGEKYSKLMSYTLKQLGSANNSVKKIQHNHEYFSFQVPNNK